MGAITFIEDLFIIRHVLARRPLDRGLHPVLGHVHTLGILKAATERRVGGRIAPTCLYGYGDLFADTGKLLGHPVPTGEHRMLSYFKNATHMISLSRL